MGKTTGFKEWGRKLPVRRDVEDRLADHKELYIAQPTSQARQQGGRCMDCGVPFCQQGCPLGNQIPDWNDMVYRDRWRDAHVRLASTNNFPEFTGRLCPAPCEGACTLAINDDAVTIEQIEQEIIERAFKEGWVEAVQPRMRTGRSVAIVGSGPAGLAAAAQLNSAGHSVTVYEAADRLGGLLRYGIPDFKMEKWVVDRRIRVMEAEGVQFETSADIGGDGLSWGRLRQENDAVLVAIGSQRPRDLQVPGRELSGVHFAMDFLTQQNQINAGDDPAELGARIDAAGKKVIILGGGDTGSDCLGTALRQGAEIVHQIELMPRPPEDRDDSNPWPQWPMIYRTSSSQQEGGERDFAVLTRSLSGTDGRLTALHAVRVEVEPRARGGLDFVEVPDSELTIEVDLVLLAMGFVGPNAERLVDQLGVELDRRGNIATNGDYASTVDGVFAAGDARRGQSLIVWAISEGREAARAVDSYLRDGDEPWLPTRGIDQPFGGR